MPIFTLIILIALAVLGFYAIRRSAGRSKQQLEDDSAPSQNGRPPRQVSDEVEREPDADKRRLGAMYSGNLGEYQKEETELAVRVANEKFGRTLDYSHRSIADVEAILGGAHDYTLMGDAKDTDNLVDWAEMFGCYIATVIQKQTGEGQLERDHQDLGDDSYPFHWKGETIFPQSWCHKRIFEGPAHDLSRKYKTEILDRIYGPTST
ncbi:MAG: hypothetical protein CME36_07430 [unclassified Hahellaceae]|nr:hypothetical protein [Hahellaceae bacterium]|tara:strand:+ start:30238 stop:30858 length:621 start_codon:yes stop_codon:yes gene_type:complete